MPSFREALKRSPAGPLLRWAARKWRKMHFRNSGDYWEARYRKGGNSGAGSYGRLSLFKAEVINAIVKEFGVSSVIEFGFGDGHQLTLAEYPAYVGFDVSETAVRHCREKFAGTKEFEFLKLEDFDAQRADLSLSLDVVYHLVEDAVFSRYMEDLFRSAKQLVLIYASNFEDPKLDTIHVRHRKFSDWIDENRPEWALIRHIPNRYTFDPEDPTTSFADFYLYERR